MARKRERLEPADGQGLLAERLQRRLAHSQLLQNSALNVLTGARPEASAQPEDGLEVIPRQLRAASAGLRRGSGHSFVPHMVYGEPENLAEIEAVAEKWSRVAQRHVSRWEALRQALRWLHWGVEKPPSGPGERHARDH